MDRIYQYFNRHLTNPCQQCQKIVHIWSYSGPHFLAFKLNVERYGVSLHIQSESGKMQSRITPNTDTFYTVQYFNLNQSLQIFSWYLTYQSLLIFRWGTHLYMSLFPSAHPSVCPFVCCTQYLRNHISSDHKFWCTCKKW